MYIGYRGNIAIHKHIFSTDNLKLYLKLCGLSLEAVVMNKLAVNYPNNALGLTNNKDIEYFIHLY